jgi:hypothetical protein
MAGDNYTYVPQYAANQSRDSAWRFVKMFAGRFLGVSGIS